MNMINLYRMLCIHSLGLPRCYRWQRVHLQCWRLRRLGFDLWVRKIWRSTWQPTPVFLPGESHGQRILEDCSPWGCIESDTTEHTAAQVYVPWATQPHSQLWLPLCWCVPTEPGPGWAPDLFVQLYSGLLACNKRQMNCWICKHTSSSYRRELVIGFSICKRRKCIEWLLMPLIWVWHRPTNVSQKYLPLCLNREAEKHSLHPPWSIQPCDKC